MASKRYDGTAVSQPERQARDGLPPQKYADRRERHARTSKCG